MSAVSAESPRGSADLTTSTSSTEASGEQPHNGPPHNGPAQNGPAQNGPAQNGPAQNGPTQNGTAAQADFGPNQWLVDELYQRYQADPGSVDQAWWSFFADYHPQPEQAAAQPAREADSPTAVQARSAAPAASTPPTPGPAAMPNAADGQAPPAGPPASSAPVTAAPAATPPVQGADSAEHTVRLRGAAARTVTNMTASLTMPTATSVRPVPAKLLVDNRIVINNHLARGRGGKISFTHLIGYAIVRALAIVPEMNFAYGEVDGKPVLVEPEHVNLGLAKIGRAHV